MRKKHKKTRRKHASNISKKVIPAPSISMNFDTHQSTFTFDTPQSTFTFDTLKAMEKMLSDWKTPTFSHQHYYKTTFSYGDIGMWGEPQTEAEKRKRKIEDKLREFDSDIRKLSKQASKIGDRANKDDRIGKKSFKGGYVSKKSLDKERNTYKIAIENLKQEKAEYYDENLEYFI